MSRLAHADPEGWQDYAERMLDAADLRRKQAKEVGLVRWNAERRTYERMDTAVGGEAQR